MKRMSFKKGIHPNDCKTLTRDKTIERLMPKDELVYPMQQHIGNPSKPIVKKGDHVLVGQKIGEENGPLGVPIYSTVSGIVKSIEERMTFKGTQVLSVVVVNDYTYEEMPYLKEEPFREYQLLTREEIRERIKEAGIVGMGGATFPTYVKLSPANPKNIKHILINGAECEPYLTSDYRVMLEEGTHLIDGIKILLHMFDKATALIGIEDNKKEAIAYLEEISQGEKKIEVKSLQTKYPQGSEKHLIYALTGQEVPAGKLPADLGVLVLNVDSVVAIWQAVVYHRPIMRRIVTVSGKGVDEPSNFRVKLGMSYRELLEAAGWDEQRTVRIISGGPMMGTAISSVDIPIEKGTSAILCLTEEEIGEYEISNCIRCGKCIEACAMRLMPNRLHQAALYKEDEMFKAYHGMQCIECGSCSYICPARRPIVQTIRTEKDRIRQNRKGE